MREAGWLFDEHDLLRSQRRTNNLFIIPCVNAFVRERRVAPHNITAKRFRRHIEQLAAADFFIFPRSVSFALRANVRGVLP